MPSSVILTSSDDFTDNTMSKLFLDPGLNAGSLFLFDFLDSFSNPHPDGVIANGARFKNLVDGGADGIYTPGTGGSSATIIVSNAANKAGLVTSGQTSGITTGPVISMGSPVATGDKPFVLTLWSKLVDVVPSQGDVLMADATEVAGANGTTRWAWAFYCITKGLVQVGQRAWGGTLTGPVTAAASFAVRQVGLGWDAGTLTLFVNGVAAGSVGGLPSPVGATGLSPLLRLTIAATHYRAYMERLDLSGRTALAAVQADYAANKDRFS